VEKPDYIHFVGGVLHWLMKHCFVGCFFSLIWWQWLKKKNMKPLVQTLEKIKDGALMDHVLLTHTYFLHLWLQNYGEGIDNPVSVTLN
jgi:hypothetical protein